MRQCRRCPRFVGKQIPECSLEEAQGKTEVFVQRRQLRDPFWRVARKEKQVALPRQLSSLGEQPQVHVLPERARSEVHALVFQSSEYLIERKQRLRLLDVWSFLRWHNMQCTMVVRFRSRGKSSKGIEERGSGYLCNHLNKSICRMIHAPPTARLAAVKATKLLASMVQCM